LGANAKANFAAPKSVLVKEKASLSAEVGRAKSSASALRSAAGKTASATEAKKIIAKGAKLQPKASEVVKVGRFLRHIV
jgi:hypothetical protein